MNFEIIGYDDGWRMHKREERGSELNSNNHVDLVKVRNGYHMIMF